MTKVLIFLSVNKHKHISCEMRETNKLTMINLSAYNVDMI